MTSNYTRFAESMSMLGWEEVHHPDYKPNEYAKEISKLFPQYFVTYKKGIFASPMGLKMLSKEKKPTDPYQAIAETEAKTLK